MHNKKFQLTWQPLWVCRRRFNGGCRTGGWMDHLWLMCLHYYFFTLCSLFLYEISQFIHTHTNTHSPLMFVSSCFCRVLFVCLFVCCCCCLATNEIIPQEINPRLPLSDILLRRAQKRSTSPAPCPWQQIIYNSKLLFTTAGSWPWSSLGADFRHNGGVDG